MRTLLKLLLAGPGTAAALALGASGAAAQSEDWRRLVSEADSIGPQTPRLEVGRSAACAPGVQVADSVEVSGPPDEYMMWARSLRTRGYFTSVRVPRDGAGRFELRRVKCDPERGHPLSFVLERDHRYFELRFSLRERPAYRALRFRTAAGGWEAFRWDPERRAFSAGAPPE